MKKNRHELILSFIQNNNVSTQDEIIKMLSEHGYNVTQATISRDIKELKLIKEHYGKNEVKYAVSTKKDNNDNIKITSNTITEPTILKKIVRCFFVYLFQNSRNLCSNF